MTDPFDPHSATGRSEIKDRSVGVDAATSAADSPRTSWARVRRTIAQLVGLAMSVALLLWCVSIALRPENRDQLENLRNASPMAIAGLLLLSAGSLFFNGLAFWSLIRPIHPVGFWSMQAVNTVATCLAYIPFKLSVVFRFLVHRRRDGVPLLTIASWLAAAGGTVLVTFFPVLAAGSAMRQSSVPTLLLGALGAAAASTITLHLIARWFSGERGRGRLLDVARFTRLSILERFAQSASFREMHTYFDMVGRPTPWIGACLSRLADLSVHVARFSLAASVLGLDLPFADAILLAASYYTLGALSPSGSLGVREGGTTGVAMLLHLPDATQYASVPLLVTAADAIPTIVGAVIGGIALRVPHGRRSG